MLTPGNHKLGRRTIWGFALPSGAPDACPGLTPTCRSDCYAVAVERYRPAAAAKYRGNLSRSRRRDFARRVRAFLVAHAVRVVRVHTGGDFYSAGYARKWLRVMRRSPRVRFFFYTRSWRVPAVRAVIDRMAAEPNVRAWYSCDRDTGVPADVPPGVRLAWLAADEGDIPPAGCHLAFRVRRLRRTPHPGGVRVCPSEDGSARAAAVTCDRCGYCWRPADPADPAGPRRLPLPLLGPR